MATIHVIQNSNVINHMENVYAVEVTMDKELHVKFQAGLDLGVEIFEPNNWAEVRIIK